MEQDSALFWSMHSALFKQQNSWGQQADPAATLATIAVSIGAESTAYEQCIDEGQNADKVEESVTQGRSLGFSGTPSFQFVVRDSGESYKMVGAYPLEEFEKRLDAILAGEPVPQDEVREPDEAAELPYWADAEGLSPDPNRPGFNMAGDAYKGSVDAPLVVIEFSDFACPACQEHALQVQPILDEEFVETGQIMWVFKNLPVRDHPNAATAAVAAECAGDQGLFWEMHHLLYEKMDDWSEGDADAVFLSWVKELDLDSDAFTQCFNSRQALERVLADIYDAQGVVNTTPNFILLSDGKGTLLQGSQSVDKFVISLGSMLDDLNSSNQDSEP
jgi:protein-disulfide isomerase